MGSEVSFSDRAAELANRVRLAEAEGVDARSSGAVGEAVQSAIRGLVPRDANEVLREAERLMPGWSAGRAMTMADGSVGVVRAKELSDGRFLSAELAHLASREGGRVRESDLRAWGAELAAAGVASEELKGAGGEALARAKAALGVPLDQEVDEARLMECLALLAEMVRALDGLAWRTFRSMAPQSEVRRRGELSVLLGRFAQGEGGESAQSVGEELAKFRQLTAGLLASIGQAGEVAYQRVSKLNPLHIESLATAEKGLGESPDVACWRKYRELAGQMDEATVTGETMRSMASFAEGLMRS